MSNQLEHIIKQCQKNDRKAQKEIYSLFASTLFSICLRYSENHADAQDVFQEGFITIYNKIGQYKFNGSFEGWLKKIMVNQALSKFRNKNYLRTVDVENLIEIEDEEVEVETEHSPDYHRLLDIVQDLPAQYRQVFNLYVFEQYTHAEIAEFLQISINTSKSNLSRARKILKEKINSLNLSMVHEKA